MTNTNTTIEPGWLPKDEAAKLLGVSVRQLEHRATRREIRKNVLPRQRNERTARVQYSVEDIKAILNHRPNHYPAPPTAISSARREPIAGLAAGYVAEILRSLPTPPPPAPPPVLRPWLTLDEAVAYSGLPKGWLLRRAFEGAPFAVNCGRKRASWRFNRDALAAVTPAEK